MTLKPTRLWLAAGLFLAAFASGSGCSSDKEKAQNESDTNQPVAVHSENVSTLPSLQRQLDERKANFSAKAPADMVMAFEAGVDQLRDSGILDKVRKVGDTAPDFTLPDANGLPVKLRDILAEGPVVLVWYRGGWCPYCNLQLRAMQQALPEIHQLGAQVIAVSPNLPDSSLSTQERDSLQFIVLSDSNLTVARQYGVVYTVPDTVMKYFKGRIDFAAYDGTDSHELPLAVTYVIGTDGVIKWAFISADYRRRAEPSDIVAELKKLQQS